MIGKLGIKSLQKRKEDFFRILEIPMNKGKEIPNNRRQIYKQLGEWQLGDLVLYYECNFANAKLLPTLTPGP